MNNLVLSSTQLSSFSECPRKWYYHFHLGRCKPPNDAMKRGTLFHKLCELNWREDKQLEELPMIIREENPELIPYLEMVLPVFISFITTQTKPEFITLDDGTPAVELEFSMDIKDYPILLKGTVDYVAKKGDNKYISDLKLTGMYLNEHYFSGFELAFQTLLYQVFGVKFFGDVTGFMISASMCRKNAAPAHQTRFFPKSPNLDEFMSEVIGTCIQIYENLDNIDFFTHRHTSCTTKFGKCPFFEVCCTTKERRLKILHSPLFEDYQDIYEPEAANVVSVKD